MCGILGIASRDTDVFADIYDGLLMLQHRGQDASGIVTYTGEFFRERKANGLVKVAFGSVLAPHWPVAPIRLSIIAIHLLRFLGRSR